MQTYKKIVAAVDFSGHTDAVIQRVLSLAQQYDAAMTVLHVVDYAWPTDVDYVLPPIDEIEGHLKKAARERLDSLLEVTGIPAEERIVAVGRPKYEILRLAEQQGADLIVLGAHGHLGLAGLLGSTTDGVLHRATCDVLVVR
jgi:universal stress protein A